MSAAGARSTFVVPCRAAILLSTRCAIVTHREVALPLGVGRIARGQRLVDLQPGAIRRQRPWPVALGHQHVADLDLTHREVALPLGVGRIARGQRLGGSPARCDTPPAPLARRPGPPARRRSCRD